MSIGKPSLSGSKFPQLGRSLLCVAALSLCFTSSYAAPANNAASASSAQASAGKGAAQHHHHHHGGHGFSVVFGPEVPDEAAVVARITHWLAHFVPDASAAQKTALEGIAKAAFNDLKTLQTQSKTAHEARTPILLAATVDRTALEANRVEQARLLDLISKRRNQADADAADTLTATQRAKITQLLAAKQPTQASASSLANILKNPFAK